MRTQAQSDTNTHIHAPNTREGTYTVVDTDADIDAGTDTFTHDIHERASGRTCE